MAVRLLHGDVEGRDVDASKWVGSFGSAQQPANKKRRHFVKWLPCPCPAPAEESAMPHPTLFIRRLSCTVRSSRPASTVRVAPDTVSHFRVVVSTRPSLIYTTLFWRAVNNLFSSANVRRELALVLKCSL
jgi:hypothetical protein